MANKTDSAPEAPATEAQPSVTLDDFCVRISETVRSPELIAGFHHVERAAGRLRGTFDEYKTRFDAFRNLPV
jgi:hypothetical protein